MNVLSGTTTCQDSVTITVNPTHQITLDSTACDSIQWDGNWLASSGTYVDTIQNVAGCDSIVTLNLTINNSITSDTSAIACDSLVWRGVTYTSSGNYSETLQTINGCDSVVTLNLTITPSPTVDLGNDTNTDCQGDSVLDAGSSIPITCGQQEIPPKRFMLAPVEVTA